MPFPRIYGKDYTFISGLHRPSGNLPTFRECISVKPYLIGVLLQGKLEKDLVLAL